MSTGQIQIGCCYQNVSYLSLDHINIFAANHQHQHQPKATGLYLKSVFVCEGWGRIIIKDQFLFCKCRCMVHRIRGRPDISEVPLIQPKIKNQADDAVVTTIMMMFTKSTVMRSTYNEVLVFRPLLIWQTKGMKNSPYSANITPPTHSVQMSQVLNLDIISFISKINFRWLVQAAV